MHKLIVAGACLAFAACAGPDPEELEQASQSGDRFIVQFAPGSASQGKAAVAAAGGQLALDLPEVNAAAAYLPGEALPGLESNPNIQLIEPDAKRYAVAETTPYGIPMVQADQVSDAGAGAVKVCIIDSGYDVAHEDLSSGSEVTGVDTSAGAWEQDGCGHGTHVAGTVAALGGNGVGVVGVHSSAGSPGLHIVRVFDDGCSWAYASDLIDAAYECRDAGAQVISMSLGCASGGPFCYSSTEDQAFADLYEQSLLSVAAASNDGKSWYSYPASYDSVISVAAVDENKDHAWFSNTNDQVELAAPGVGVLSTVPGNDYEAWSGTSMATPHVSGVAALVWSHDTSRSNQDIRDALTATAEDLGSAGRDESFGYGLVRAKAALDYLAGGSTCEPTEDPESSCDDGVDNDCDGLTDGDDDDCASSCEVTEDPETSCDDGIDNDCDGLVDGDDDDCQTGGTCDLGQKGDPCDSDADCCGNKCRGKPGARTCK